MGTSEGGFRTKMNSGGNENLGGKRYRLVAIDLDDTLLTDDLTITEGTRRALAAAAAQGGVVTIATGRMFASAARIAGGLGLNVPIITYQGALVKNLLDGRVLYERTVPTEPALAIVEYAAERGLHLQGYVDDRMYAVADNDKSRAYAALSGVTYETADDFTPLVRRGALKLLIIDEPEKLDRMLDELRGRTGGAVHITKSKPHFLEILHPEATKGHALMHLARHFGISREETIGIGDSWNDRELIEMAGLGVAMGNAVEALKAIADYVAAGNNEEGVREVIEKFVLAQS